MSHFLTVDQNKYNFQIRIRIFYGVTETAAVYRPQH